MSSKSQVIYDKEGDDWSLDKPEKADFEMLPEGMYDAVCIEVVPPTIRKDFHGNPQAQIRFVFAVSEKKTTGEQHTVSTRWLAIKTHPKSNMGKILRLWLGSGFPSEQALEDGTYKMKANLEGRPAKLTIEHEADKKDDTMWVRITRIKELSEGSVTPDGKYVRTTDREDAEAVVDVNKELDEGDDEPF